MSNKKETAGEVYERAMAQAAEAYKKAQANALEAYEKSRYSIPTIVDVGNDAFKDGRKAGIKEVVEWMQWYGGLPEWIDMHMPEQWQAKLKEWGVSND